MNTYLSTCVSGLTECVKEWLLADIEDCEIQHEEDGLLVYTTETSLEDIKDLAYVNNTFLLLSHITIAPGDNTTLTVNRLYNEGDLSLLHNKLDRKGTFRVVASEENQFVSMPGEFVNEVNAEISAITGWQEAPLKAKHEFWFIIRREGAAFFGLRLTGLDGLPQQEKGELRPELAYIMCRLAQTKDTDIVLDPFAGNGAIPESMLYFPHYQIIANDNHVGLVQKLQKKFRKFSTVVVTQEDGRELKSLPDGSIGTIITDPPWGLFTMQDTDYVAFYTQMLTRWKKLLKEDGIMLVLTAKKDEFEAAYTSHTLSLKKKYDILVSGKKAAMYVLANGRRETAV